jgi:hypothetical protein
VTLRTARLVRAATFVMAGVLVALVVSRFFADPPKDEHIDPARGTFTVNEAVQKISPTPIPVRGFVFEGPGGLGLRLCDSRKPGSPPSCIGPFLDLQGQGIDALDLRSGKDDHGRRIRWSPDPVTLLGPVHGARLDVQQVLR